MSHWSEGPSSAAAHASAAAPCARTVRSRMRARPCRPPLFVLAGPRRHLTVRHDRTVTVCVLRDVDLPRQPSKAQNRKLRVRWQSDPGTCGPPSSPLNAPSAAVLASSQLSTIVAILSGMAALCIHGDTNDVYRVMDRRIIVEHMTRPLSRLLPSASLSRLLYLQNIAVQLTPAHASTEYVINCIFGCFSNPRRPVLSSSRPTNIVILHSGSEGRQRSKEGEIGGPITIQMYSSEGLIISMHDTKANGRKAKGGSYSMS